LLLDVQEAVGAKAGSRLHGYLQVQLARKRRLEATRLFYVGCTRAARRLYLSATLPWKAKDGTHGPPSPASLLAALWPTLGDLAEVRYITGDLNGATVELPYRRLSRLPDVPQLPPRDAHPGGTIVIPDNRAARALGTAVHRALEALVYRSALPEACDDALRDLLRVGLLENGADRPVLATLLDGAVRHVDRCLADAWLRWALDPRRRARRAEHPLSLRCADGVRSLVVDYIFTDEQSGETWVVDYKTSQPAEGETLEAFFATQTLHYREQLESYRSAVAATGAPRVRCALYFPALGRHAELPEDIAD
jgi:ATP-dependent exoDNAse (exonuclease V) beta subunit